LKEVAKMRAYEGGDTPFITCDHEIYDFTTDAWALTNPDAGFPKITLMDKNGVKKVDAVTMDAGATGKFSYLYTIGLTPVKGWWKGYIDVENGTYPDREWFGFEVR
jgi:hypothetical protein